MNRIVIGIDDAFLFPALVLITSAQESSAKSLTWLIYFFEEDFTVENRNFLSRWAKSKDLNFQLVPKMPEAIFDSRRHLSRSTFLKFLAMEELREPFLWLDSDILALPGWDKVFDLASKNGFYAVPRQGLGGAREFNSGVMFWNTDERPLWRPVVEEFPKIRESSDQVVFNKIYGTSFLSLPAGFNWLAYKVTTAGMKEKPFLVHYAGAYKPWHLHTSLFRYCKKDMCVWTPYHAVINQLLESEEFGIEIGRLHEQSRSQGRFYFVGSGRVKVFLALISRFDTVRAPAVWALRLFRPFFPPQAFHPVHRIRGVWSAD